MFKHLVALAAAAVLITPAAARIEAFPGTFHSQMVQTNGTSLFVRVGGRGPAVILLRITRWAAIDAPLPGIGNWDSILRSPLLWHFNFRGPDEERLVQGRERIYLDRFYNELSADPKTIDTETRDHYAALYSKPHAMHDAFEQFGAFSQDAVDNKALLARGGKLTMPVLGVGGEKSFGPGMADELRFVADRVSSGIVPHSGHWIMEENPQATVEIVTEFLAK